MPVIHLPWHSYQIILYSWIAVAVLIFFLLLKITAPYGRHSSAKWGPQLPNHIGWLLMELPVLIVLWLLLWPFRNSISNPVWVMIALFSFHYLYRSLIFPFRLRTKGKKMPWLIAGSAVFFNIMNGFGLGYYFTRFASYDNNWFSDPRFITGLVLFIAGVYINWKADAMLIALRKPGEAGYKIPQGWLFKYISCPNLFGEILEWAGFALLCWNIPALAFFVWTIANLVPRAIAHHRWYIEKFADYPKERKAVIPLVI
jgi:hypothetical protein